jgi:HK97 family phage portal protein
MRLGPFIITRRKAAGETITYPPQGLVTQWPPSGGGFWPQIRESFAGAWQRRITVPVEDALTHPTFWSCVTLIAGDIAKMRPMLITEDADGICTEIDNTAYSPVLRKPNHYQNRIQFYMYWILSKLTRGNAYALKERDKRGVVTALYLMDSSRVRPMVSPGGFVFYALQQDLLAGVTELDQPGVVVPASEIIHDVMYAPYHPLCGMSPVYACGHAAMQGLKIMQNSTVLFENGSQVGGILTAPASISDQVAKRLQEHWQQNYAGTQNAGKVAVLGDGLKFEKPPVMSAVDAQLIEQLKWDDEKVCSTFHVPAYMVGVGAAPAYNNIEALNQQYYSQCLQVLIESLELCLLEGLELNPPMGIEFDLGGLLRMDTVQQMDVATKGVTGGIFSPNEGRRRFNLGKVPGGESVYLQKQCWPLVMLGSDGLVPTNTPAPKPEPPPDDDAVKVVEDFDEVAFYAELTKAVDEVVLHG